MTTMGASESGATSGSGPQVRFSTSDLTATVVVYCMIGGDDGEGEPRYLAGQLASKNERRTGFSPRVAIGQGTGDDMMTTGVLWTLGK